MEVLELSKVLVTGGTGFIGSYLVKSLIDNGSSVVVLDNNYRGTKSNLNNFKNRIDFVEGDIRDKEVVKKALDNVTTVFHLAFINGTNTFYSNPDLVLDVGLKGIINLLDLIKDSDVKNFIFASSSEVYQTPKKIPTDEEEECKVPDIKNPRYSYGSSKLIGEIMTMHYLADHNIQTKIFRPHNVYGPAMGWGHVIPQLIKKIYLNTNKFQNKSCEIIIQGTGLETRAFCFVDDAVEAILLVASNGKDKEIYNIGTDHEIKIKDLVIEIAKLLDIKINIKEGELLPGGTNRRCPDIKKIEALGFKNKTNLYEGIKKTVMWYKEKLLESND